MNTIEEMIERHVRLAVREELEPVLERLGELKDSQQIPTFVSPVQLSKVIPYKPARIRQMWAQGKIPGHKPNGRLLFKLDEVQKSLQRNKKSVIIQEQAKN